jgi:coenzyme Q-binding protein COQ10
VRCEPETGEVEVALVQGPLHSLQNKWWFRPHEKGAHVRYWIAYEFKNALLQAAISANRDKLAGRIMAAFETEARRRLG